MQVSWKEKSVENLKQNYKLIKSYQMLGADEYRDQAVQQSTARGANGIGNKADERFYGFIAK